MTPPRVRAPVVVGSVHSPGDRLREVGQASNRASVGELEAPWSAGVLSTSARARAGSVDGAGPLRPRPPKGGRSGRSA